MSSSSTVADSASEPPRLPADISLAAQALSRDGILFLAVGALFLVCAAGVVLAVPRDNPEALSGLSVCLTSSMVFFGVALLKLKRARQAGVQTFGARAASIGFWLYCALALILMCGFVLPRFLSHYLWSYTSIVCWTVPAMVSGVALLREFLNGKGLLQYRAAYALALCYLGFIFSVGVNCSDAMSLLLGKVLFLGTLPSVVGLGLSVFFFVIALLNLRALRRQSIQTRSTVWLNRAAWLYFGVLLICAARASSLGDYWGAAALVAFGALSRAIGDALAGIRQHGQPSRLRRALFTLPLALLTLFLAIVANMVGTAFTAADNLYSESEYTLSHTGIWYLPDPLRAPLAARLAAVNWRMETGLFASGLMSLADLKAAALSPGKKTYLETVAWMAWADRDPAALSVALAVPPPPPGSPLPSVAYDYGAGCAIGSHGSVDDIRTRLTNNYSSLLVSGIIVSLPEDKLQEFAADFMAYYQRNINSSPAWHGFAKRYPSQVRRIVLAFFKSSDPAHYELLHGSSFLWASQPLEGVVQLALDSSDPLIRKIALEKPWLVRYRAEFNAKLVQIASGQVPNPDPNEQRAAAAVLDHNGTFFAGYSLVYNAPPVPLMPSEQLAIQHICAAAQSLLDKAHK